MGRAYANEEWDVIVSKCMMMKNLRMPGNSAGGDEKEQ